MDPERGLLSTVDKVAVRIYTPLAQNPNPAAQAAAPAVWLTLGPAGSGISSNHLSAEPDVPRPLIPVQHLRQTTQKRVLSIQGTACN